MASYYYLVASLPLLRPEETPPMTSEAFLDTCRQSLGQSDLELVSSASLVVSEDGLRHHNIFLRQWNVLLENVRKEMNLQRSRRLNIENSGIPQLGGRDPWIADMIRDIMQAENPLQAELQLLHFYWQRVDGLSTGHVFDVEFLIAYHVKLKLMARRSLFTPTEGNGEFKRLFSNLQTIIKSI